MATYRNLLEVLKWASPKDTLLRVSCVSTLWNTVSESEELWMEYCEGTECEDSGSSRKQQFRHFHESHTLALIAPKKLFLYDTAENRWRSVSLSCEIAVDKSTAWVAVDSDFISAGGGAGFIATFDCCDEKMQQAFKVSRDGQVRRLADIATPRMWQGMVRYQDWVFVFGGLTCVEGREIDTNSAEKISVSRLTQWEPEAPMISSRRCFNPCVWQTLIYIFGGSCSESEVFSPEERRYASLPVQLVPNHCSAFRDRGTFVLLSGGLITSWDGVNQFSRDFSSSYAWGNMCPVLRSSVCWVAQTYNNFAVMKLNIETREVLLLNPPDFQQSDFSKDKSI